MSQKAGGRPRKISSEEKMAIVTRYYVECAAEDGSVLQQHGIYAKLAAFASQKGYSLAAHDFSRDEQVKAHMKSLSFGMVSAETNAIPVYEPLDLSVVIMKSRKDLEHILKDRESYFLSLHQRAARAIEGYVFLSESKRVIEEKLKRMEKEHNATETKNIQLEKELREYKSENAYLTRYIRKHLNPARAEEFMKSMSSQGASVETARASVMNSLDALCKEDKEMKNLSKKDASSAYILNLF